MGDPQTSRRLLGWLLVPLITVVATGAWFALDPVFQLIRPAPEAADAQLRVVYKEFPILGPNSTFSAKAALAVHRQGKYHAFHKEMMLDRGVADGTKVLRIAAKIGVDVERMKSDMNDPPIAAMVERNLALARALRISGTPSFVIGEQIVRGAVDLKTLQALIRESRGKQ